MEYHLDERRVRNFWKKVIKTETCWIWVGYIDKIGYGVFGVNPKSIGRAHRYSYELLVGPIPEGLEIDHVCSNRKCVNPAHLEPVTHIVNVRRSKRIGWNMREKTHCPKGHPLSGDNVYRHNGRRHCRKCNYENSKRWRLENPEKVRECAKKSRDKRRISRIKAAS